MKLILDLSNLCHTSLRAGKDKEFGCVINVDGEKIQINSAGYGFDRALDFLAPLLRELNLTPRQIICVEEGRDARSFRTNMFADYKKAATKNPKPPEVYEQFNLLKQLLKDALLPLGAQFVTQPNVEADDVIAYFAKHLPQTTLVTTDKDMQACVSDTCRLWHAGRFNENRLGPFPIRYTTLYKALVGDAGDNIKGAKGFGDTAFLDLWSVFGDDGLDMMQTLIESRQLEKLSEDVGSLKSLQKIIDDRDNVYMSHDLAKLYPDRVNTMRRPLVWELRAQKPFEVDARLQEWANRGKLVHADNYESTLNWFAKILEESPFVAFDIETTTPPESDEWLMARAKKSDEDGARLGVDVLGSTLAGFSATLGDNGQFTIYASVDHNGADGLKNITKAQAAEFIKLVPKNVPIVVQNSAFELSVLHREWGGLLQDNGFHGFLPNVHDTKIMASHVNENVTHGLKDLSLRHFGYKQVSYDEATQGRKMHECSASEIFSYGADDTICTSGLYNHFQTVMQMEGSWGAYLAVDTKPPYMTALAFNEGTAISMESLLAQEQEDQLRRAAGWQIARQYLIERGWPGTVPPSYTADITAAQIKEAYTLVTGEVLETKVRTPEKLVALIRSKGDADLLAALIEEVIGGQSPKNLNEHVQSFFNGEPEFKFNSPKQLTRLFYDEDCLGLPVRLRNKATDNMRAAGLREGNPTTDALSLEYALKYDIEKGSEKEKIVKAVQVIKIADTKQSLYYTPYRVQPHWKTGLIHAAINQSATNTRRYTASGPNVQQLPKHAKATGEPARFREIFVPHHPDAVIISLDFTGQELVLIADYSRDPNMLSCFIGDNKQDMHALTGIGVLKRRMESRAALKVMDECNVKVSLDDTVQAVMTWDASKLKSLSGDKSSPWQTLAFIYRQTGKKINFTTEFGAMAPKLARTMLVEVDEAQSYIDAKLEAFPRADAWKQEVIAETLTTGVSYSKMGAVRHLGPALLSSNGYDAMKAERQAVNYKIQGSGAEQTKLGMTRVWEQDVLYKFDCRFLFPVHDELVFSVLAKDVIAFLNLVHPAMVAKFADTIVPAVCGISLGKNFGAQIEVGDFIDRGLIEKTLEDLGFDLCS